MIRLALFSLIFLGINCRGFSQTAEEVIQKYLHTIGEDFKTLYSFKVESESDYYFSSIDEKKIASIHYEKKPNLSRSDIWIDGELINSTRAFDGKIAWKQKGNQQAEQESDYITSLMLEGVFPFGGSLVAPMLINAEENRAEIAFLGAVVIDEVEYYELERQSEGQNLYFYINTSTNLLEIRSQQRLQKKVLAHHANYTLLKDYRQVGNYLVFHKTESWINGNLSFIDVIKQITFNPDLPDSLFQFPEKP